MPIIRSKINKEDNDKDKERGREKGSEISKLSHNDKSSDMYYEKDGDKDKDRERDKVRERGRKQGRDEDTDKVSRRELGNKNGLIVHDQTMSVQAARSCVMLNVKELVTSLGSAADGITRAAVVTSLGSAALIGKVISDTAVGSTEDTMTRDRVIDTTHVASTISGESMIEAREKILTGTGTGTGTEDQGQDADQNIKQKQDDKQKNIINDIDNIDKTLTSSSSSGSSSSSLPDIGTKCLEAEVGIWGGLHGGGPGSNMQNFVLVGTYVICRPSFK